MNGLRISRGVSKKSFLWNLRGSRKNLQRNCHKSFKEIIERILKALALQRKKNTKAILKGIAEWILEESAEFIKKLPRKFLMASPKPFPELAELKKKFQQNCRRKSQNNTKRIHSPRNSKKRKNFAEGILKEFFLAISD